MYICASPASSEKSVTVTWSSPVVGDLEPLAVKVVDPGCDSIPFHSRLSVWPARGFIGREESSARGAVLSGPNAANASCCPGVHASRHFSLPRSRFTKAHRSIPRLLGLLARTVP